jgi:hypothetical protein
MWKHILALTRRAGQQNLRTLDVLSTTRMVGMQTAQGFNQGIVIGGAVAQQHDIDAGVSP